MGAPTPVFIAEAFAVNADSAYITTPIPETTSNPARASLDLGFPPQTMQEKVSGGTPPYGQDMNGILYMLSSHTVYVQSGQPYKYSSDVSTAIGGYAIGTLLGASSGLGFWLNVTDGNTTDPDASGAGWVPVNQYGHTSISTTGGTVTLTRLQAAKPVIVVSGVLTSNVSLVLPATEQTWLIVNATSGSYTVTAKTASGTGVTCVQGGYASPTGVYGDGTNIYNTVSPLAYAIASAATANTIALRDNTGGIAATRFNQSSATESSVAVGSVFVQNTAADGNLRKIPLANFMAQLALSSIGGSVVASQVPKAAITQYYAQSFVTNGYCNFPNGLQVRWGYVTSVGAKSFASPFTNGCLNVQMTMQGSGTPSYCPAVYNLSATGFAWNRGGTGTEGDLAYYFAIGY